MEIIIKVNIKCIQYIAFICIGIVGNIIGPLLPAIQGDLSLSYSQSGLLLSEAFLGMICVGIAGSYLMDKYGKKPFLLAGGVFLIIGLFGSTLSQNFTQLYILNFITGMGFGIYDVGINAICADYSGDHKGSEMNFLHFFYGLGAILAPIIAMFCIYLHFWRLCFGIFAIFPIVVTVLLLMFKSEKIKPPNTFNTINDKPSVNPLKSPLLWMAGATISIYVGLEVSAAGWLPTFWKSAINTSIISPSLSPTLFWIAITVGRLKTGKIADTVGLKKFIFLSSLSSMFVCFAWVFLPSGISTILIILLLGILLAGIYPTIMALSTASFPRNTGLIAALLSLFGSIGGVFLPALIGKASDNYGIRILPLSIFVLSILLIIFSSLLWKSKNKLSAL